MGKQQSSLSGFTVNREIRNFGELTDENAYLLAGQQNNLGLAGAGWLRVRLTGKITESFPLLQVDEPRRVVIDRKTMKALANEYRKQKQNKQ